MDWGSGLHLGLLGLMEPPWPEVIYLRTPVLTGEEVGEAAFVPCLQRFRGASGWLLTCSCANSGKRQTRLNVSPASGLDC